MTLRWCNFTAKHCKRINLTGGLQTRPLRLSLVQKLLLQSSCLVKQPQTQVNFVVYLLSSLSGFLKVQKFAARTQPPETFSQSTLHSGPPLRWQWEVWCVYVRSCGLVGPESFIVRCPQSWSLAWTDKRASPRIHFLLAAITGSQDRFHYANRQLRPCVEVGAYVCVCVCMLLRYVCVDSQFSWIKDLLIPPDPHQLRS